MITFLKSGQASSTPIFFVLYLLAAVVQIWFVILFFIHIIFKESVKRARSSFICYWYLESKWNWNPITIFYRILLHTAHWLIHLMWKRSIDPDNSAIPYLTALGDLLGGGLLALAFQILVAIKGPEPDLDHFLTDPWNPLHLKSETKNH